MHLAGRLGGRRLLSLASAGRSSVTNRYRSPRYTDRTNSTTSPAVALVVRSKRKAGECTGTPSSSASSGEVTVGSIVWTPEAIVMPRRVLSSS